MSPDLPQALRTALARELDGVTRDDLPERAARTSAAYRAGGTSAQAIREPRDALAYALTRLPATYAACASVFAEAEDRLPDFAPARLLDAGVGTAAASWAATEVWPGLTGAAWLDANPPFLALAARLTAEGPAALRAADARRVDLAGPGPWPAADLVVASYVLAEMTPDKQAGLVQSLWAACEGVLILIEPGTPAGHARILAAREALIAAAAAIVAPCPHAQACPLIGPDWCHFSVRLPRGREHRQIKAVDAPFEDEKFAYLVVARPGLTITPPTPRILAPPRAGKPGVTLKLCEPDGALQSRFIGKRDKVAFGMVRRLGWGDRLPT